MSKYAVTERQKLRKFLEDKANFEENKDKHGNETKSIHINEIMRMLLDNEELSDMIKEIKTKENVFANSM